VECGQQAVDLVASDPHLGGGGHADAHAARHGLDQQALLTLHASARCLRRSPATVGPLGGLMGRRREFGIAAIGKRGPRVGAAIAAVRDLAWTGSTVSSGGSASIGREAGTVGSGGASGGASCRIAGSVLAVADARFWMRARAAARISSADCVAMGSGMGAPGSV